MRRILVSTFLVFLFMTSASVDGQAPKWKGTVEYEEGIKVVRNTNKSLFGEVSYRLEEELSIGKSEPENYLFYRIRDVAVDRDGNIYVADMSNYRVQVFDRNGEYLRTIGRSGEGPGEFERPTKIRIDNADDRIFVEDASRVLEIFDMAGKPAGAFRTSQPVGMISDFWILDNQEILLKLWRSYDLKEVHALSRMDSDGSVVGTLFEFPYNMWVERKGRATISGTAGFELELCMARLKENTFVYGYPIEYKFSIMDQDGKIRLSVTKDAPKPEFTKEDKKQSGRIPLPEVKPYFFEILCDSEGRIYVQENKAMDIVRGYGPIDIKPKEVDVFSAEGIFLYTTILPPNTCIIDRGILYARDMDEDSGLETVKRYRITNWGELKTGID